MHRGTLPLRSVLLVYCHICCGSAGVRVGDAVAIMLSGCFAEFCTIPAKYAIVVPKATAETVALLTSGLTASIALEQAGRMGTGETVLVTAAAGGLGQFVVQLAKLAG
jgi:NADPH:quinone reductase-like Zn-dependent oxidoreductase